MMVLEVLEHLWQVQLDPQTMSQLMDETEPMAVDEADGAGPMHGPLPLTSDDTHIEDIHAMRRSALEEGLGRAYDKGPRER